jgi:zinc transport system permease protein
LAVCLDRQQAELQGVNVLIADTVLLCLVALTVICLTHVVGLILVIALLTLPAATAAHRVRRLAGMMIVSTVLCVVLTTAPRIAVYELEKQYSIRISAESSIVLTAGMVYLISVFFRRIRLRPRSVAAP